MLPELGSRRVCAWGAGARPIPAPATTVLPASGTVPALSRSAYFHGVLSVLKRHWSRASEGGVLAGGGPGADTSSLDRWTLIPGAPPAGEGKN